MNRKKQLKTADEKTTVLSLPSHRAFLIPKTPFVEKKRLFVDIFNPSGEISLPLSKNKFYMNTKTEKPRNGILFGIILISLGTLLIVSNVGLLRREFRTLIISWQMLLIVIGTVSIIKRHAFHFHGFFMICIGIFFIIPKIAKLFPATFSGIDAENFVLTFWPILLIVGGIVLILHFPRTHLQRRHRRSQCKEKHARYRNEASQENDENCPYDENFSKTCVFGNGRYLVVDTQFKGGTVQAIFGGIELDLRKASLPEGETVLNVEAIFGGIELFVPDNWLIEIRVESVLGGIDDVRVTSIVEDSTRKLIIKGSAVFGGLEIRN